MSSHKAYVMNKYFNKRNILIFLASFFVFYKVYLGDYLQYREVVSSKSISAVNKYYRNFENGWYIEEVKVEEVKITRDIVKVRNFLVDYPESEYYYDIEEFRLILWNQEINYFNEVILDDLGNYDLNAVNFFRDLLFFMRDNNKAVIKLSLKGDVNVLDFSDYPQEVTSLIDLAYEFETGIPVTDNIVSLSETYSKGNLVAYETEIASSIENCFGNILSDNFITVNRSSFLGQFASNDDLVIEVRYKIKNQLIEGLGFEGDYPEVWTYTVDDIFDSYILGIDVNFVFDFKIPNGEVYNFSYNSNPESSIENIENIRDGYQIMTKQNFLNFASIIDSKFNVKMK